MNFRCSSGAVYFVVTSSLIPGNRPADLLATLFSFHCTSVGGAAGAILTYFGNVVNTRMRVSRGYAASHRAVAKLTSGILPLRVQVRSFLNNVVEQDHRRISSESEPMLGFKRFETAAVTIRGIPVSRENQETTVQPQTPNRKNNPRSGNLGRGLGRLKSAKPSRKTQNIH